MVIQQFLKNFKGCQISKAGGAVTGQDEVESWDGIVFCIAGQTKCVYWIERDADYGSPIVFSVDKIWEQERDEFRTQYGTGQGIPTIPTAFRCYLLKQKDGSAGFTKHCDEIVLRDVGQATDVYCIERKETEPRIDELLRDEPWQQNMLWWDMRWRNKLFRIRAQLQGGAKCVSENLNSSGNVRFLPVLVAKLNADPMTPYAYQHLPVKFNQTKYMIKRLEEGEKLPDM